MLSLYVSDNYQTKRGGEMRHTESLFSHFSSFFLTTAKSFTSIRWERLYFFFLCSLDSLCFFCKGLKQYSITFCHDACSVQALFRFSFISAKASWLKRYYNPIAAFNIKNERNGGKRKMGKTRESLFTALILEAEILPLNVNLCSLITSSCMT